MKMEVEAMEAKIVEEVDFEWDAVCEMFRDVQELTYDMAHAFVENVLAYLEDRRRLLEGFGICMGKG